MSEPSEHSKIEQERAAANREFDRRICELQESCPHEELTDWLQGYERRVRMCVRCHKYVEMKSTARRWCYA